MTNIVACFPLMKLQFMIVNLVGMMFETVDFASLPLSESETLFRHSIFITSMLTPIGEDDATRIKQLPLIRVSVFEPAKQFITFMFHNSEKLILDEKDTPHLENDLCWIHLHIKNMELRSDELDAAVVSELVKWEMRTMVEMENEMNFGIVFQSMLNRTFTWKQDKPERQKRREERLRDEGWDDVFELRVVGIEGDTDEKLLDLAAFFRIELAFNADEL